MSVEVLAVPEAGRDDDPAVSFASGTELHLVPMQVKRRMQIAAAGMMPLRIEGRVIFFIDFSPE